MPYPEKVEAALFGLAVGDALGVPVEFKNRDTLRKEPVTGLRGYGTHHQPPGTWSDDSSLAFCLADSLCTGYDLDNVAKQFIAWYQRGHWTPHSEVFDIGNTTREAIHRLMHGEWPTLAGGFDEEDNGNGSLMRILPLLFYVHSQPAEERYRLTREVSSMTHGHLRSVLACFIYLEFARQLLAGHGKQQAYENTIREVHAFLEEKPFNPNEIQKFTRILSGTLRGSTEAQIQSSGYVLHTLEASLWCLLTEDTYAATVLKAVNLGGDTDTTGAVAGGLAGLLYGTAGIPAGWLDGLVRRADIGVLARRLAAATAPAG
ncbi:MAG: ADP-ribosylglycohydrolase [uncultured Cytophagales bacterium]|uniref:ADP-ribosylglycohydrolase n=1 Tax=uncultured Cytophagales bacterium TaxID=158755 RepID=A0A6J4HHD7_9SPHI|nr:MAG: ADP-ribosylglycohydrolase [uncultured Cytophagales bacterium]